MSEVKVKEGEGGEGTAQKVSPEEEEEEEAVQEAAAATGAGQEQQAGAADQAPKDEHVMVWCKVDAAGELVLSRDVSSLEELRAKSDTATLMAIM